MRWVVALGCGVGLFAFAAVFRGALHPLAPPLVSLAAFAFGLARPRALHWLAAFAGSGVLAALVFHRRSLDLAPYALFPCAFTALHAFLHAPAGVVARPRSPLRRAQARQILFRAAAVVFASSLFAHAVLRARPFDAALVFGSFSVAALFWAAAVAQLGKLLGLAARVSPIDSAEAREPMPEIDLGVGDATSVLDARPAAGYRGIAVGAGTLRGDLHGLIARVWRHVRGGGVFLALALVTLVRPGVRWARDRSALHQWTDVAPSPHEPVPTSSKRLGWYPQRAPVLADINGDGLDDIIGLRWDWDREAMALSVVANDGQTFARIWETPSFQSQWASSSTQLALSGQHLFLTDSEGVVRVLDLGTGAIRATGVAKRMHEMCAASGGADRVWVSGEGDAYANGWLFAADGSLTTAERPDGCVMGDVPFCKGDEVTLCAPTRRPKELDREKGFVDLSRMGGHAVAVVTAPNDAQQGLSVISYDPHTLETRWKRPLALTEEPLHASPAVAHQQDGDVLYVKYQLKSGGWKFGGRNLVTGEVLWSKNPPGATAGSHVPSMFAKSKRLYVRVNSELEIIDGTSGKRLGVAR